jgi:hypothetical protein
MPMAASASISFRLPVSTKSFMSTAPLTREVREEREDREDA